ncbi:MAG: tetratricopeptide repeat protein [Cyclobacteriaceae bacterium]
MKNRYRLWVFCLLLWQIDLVYEVNSETLQSALQNPDSRYLQELDSITFSKQDSSILTLQKQLKNHLSDGDTLRAIESLNLLSEIYCNRVNYDKSYDGYWRALLLADAIGTEAPKAESYNGLAILYSLYERRDEALKYYLKALNVNKNLIAKGQLDNAALLDNYFLLAIHFRYDFDVPTARAYLDSSRVVLDKSNPTSGILINAEYGYLLIQEKKFEESEMLLLEAEEKIQTQVPRYLVILHTLMGDLYKDWGKYPKSEVYYKSALNNANKYKRHLNYVPDVYEKLSDLYSLMNKPTEAFESLIRANLINKSLYSSRSPNNRYLLEIKDDFRIEKEKREKLAREQRLALLEHEDRIWLLKFSILGVTIIFLLITGFIAFRYWRSKHKSERKMLEQEQKLEAQKSREILNLKNKELTGSALQLIEKDEFLSELKTNLKEISKKPDTKEINKLVKTINFNSNNNWKEFERRFIDVNEEFYQRLKERYPNLNQYDLKICALLRLNFSGKEMARLLGISAESAHTSRYRLRKKFGLDREISLVDFIADI